MAKHVFLYSAARASPVTFAAHKSNAQSPTRDGYTFVVTAKLMTDLRIAQRRTTSNSDPEGYARRAI